MSATHRTPALPTGQTAEDRRIRAIMHEKMLNLKLRGRTHRQIADEIGCHIDTVKKQMPRLLDKQAANMSQVAKREILIQIGILDTLLGQLFVEWEKSCGQRKETVTKNEGGGEYKPSGTNGNGPPQAVPNGKFKSSSAETLIDGIGDPRLVEQIRAVMADKRRLLRLDKDDNLLNVLNATQINIIQPGGKDNPMAVFTPMDPAALAETAQLLASLGMNPDGTPFKQLPDPNVIEATFKELDFTDEDALKLAKESILYEAEADDAGD